MLTAAHARFKRNGYYSTHGSGNFKYREQDSQLIQANPYAQFRNF
jgi:hypothetical protein